MKLKCIVACNNSNGNADFFPCKVEVSSKEYEDGGHYDKARDLATDAGYDANNTNVVFDEKDGPAFLFDQLFPKETPIKMRKYASLAWTPGDVKTLRPKWSLKKCEEELADNQKHIRDRLCEMGWDVIDSLIAPKDGHADLR